MTLSPRILLCGFLMACLLALPVTVVQASPHSELVPNPEAETYLLEALRAGGRVDFEVFPEDERIIRGEALVGALKDSQVQSHSFILIANVTVMDEVYANDLVLPGNIEFFQMEFTDYVDFDSSVLRAFWIIGSTFQGTLDLSLATFEGNILLSDNTFEDLWFWQAEVDGSLDMRGNTFNLGANLAGTHITEELFLNDSQFLGTERLLENPPIQFWTITVEGFASFYNTHFAGEADFSQSEFYRLDMQGAVFEQAAYFAGTTVERVADFSNARFNQLADFTDFTAGTKASFMSTSFDQLADFTNFSSGNTATFEGANFHGQADFENTTIARDITFKNASFEGPANLKYIIVGRFCDFEGTLFKDEFLFEYTNVAWPYFKGVTFDGSVSFEGTQASEDFEITDSRYNYPEAAFSVALVTVGGAGKFENFSAPAGLTISGSQFESLNIHTEDRLAMKFINLSETDIEDGLSIMNIDVEEFIAEGATIGKSTNLNNVRITEKLEMRNASIGFLKIDKQPQWPSKADNFKLHGMTYTDIDIGDKGLTQETFHALLELVNRSEYSSQAYEALSQFVTNKGHSDWAGEVELNQKRRERKQILTRFSGAWFWSWFLDIFAGYGQRPVFAFVWSGLVIAIGAYIFRRKEDMLPVEQEAAQLEYNPVWYSFSLFLPYIDLGIASKWEPSPCRKWARNYKYIHMMLGWILAPIALLTFSGIIG